MPRLLHIDAFVTDAAFSGNPAAVCFLAELSDAVWMQAVAAQMALSETAFVAPRTDGDWDLRWFTPAAEVALCGHATLATAHAVWAEARAPRKALCFHTASGVLWAKPMADGRVELDFPALPTEPTPAPAGLLDALGLAEGEVLRSRFDVVVVLDEPEQVAGLRPDLAALEQVEARGVIVTARGGAEADVVSRFFAPRVGVPEDPVTGSAHCVLAPLWAERLGVRTLSARQLSVRGGALELAVEADRVLLRGRARTVLQGALFA